MNFDIEQVGKLTLEELLVKAQDYLSEFAVKPDFHPKLNIAFGNLLDTEKAENLRQQWASGDFTSLPEVEIRSGEEIQGANSAFSIDTNKIYLSQEYILENVAEPSYITHTLLEEIGHFVDAQINSSDALGDEGAIFSSLIQGEITDQAQLQQLRAEDDTATITLDGQLIQIEKATVSDSGGFEGSQKTITLDSNGGGVASFRYEHFFIPDNFIIRYEGKNLLETGFVGGSKSGTVQIPEGNSNQLEVIMATNNSGTGWNYTVTTEGCADTSPLTIELADGEFEDTDGDGDCDGQGTIFIGLDRVGNLIRVENATAEYDSSSLRVAGGTVFSEIGNISVPLFKGDFEIPFTTGITSSLLELANLPNEFNLGGLEINLDTLELGNNIIGLQGSVQMPDNLGGFLVEVSEDDKVIIDNTGASITGGKISLPGNRKFVALDLLEIETEDLGLEVDFNNKEATLQGKILIPTLNDLSFDLSGDNHITVKDANDGLQLAMAADISATEIPIFGEWKLQDVNVNVDKAFNENGNVEGSAKFKTPNEEIDIDFTFKDGKLDEIAAMPTNEGTDFTWFGTEVDVQRIGFKPDINPGDDDSWEPQFELQGKIKLPEKLGSITLDVTDPNKLIVTEDGFDLTGGKIDIPDFEFSVLDLLEVKAENLSLEYQKKPEEFFKIQGKVSIPTLYNVTADFAGDNFIKIDDSGVDVVGVLSAEDIAIVPNVWELKEAKLSFGEGDEVKGEATILIPTGIEIGAGVGFVNNELNFVSLEANDLNKPIGTTGAFLQDIAGQVDNIAESDPDPLEFQGGVGITAGVEISVSLPSWAGGGFSGSLAEFNVTGNINNDRLKADGNISIIGGLIEGTGNAELNWNQGFLTAGANFSVLGGLITTSSSFRANSNLDIRMGGSAAVNIPDIIPIFGGRQLGSGSYLLEYSNDGSLSNDFIAGWGTASISIPFFGDYSFTKGVKVFFDGDFDIIGAEDIPTTNSFDVAPDTEWILLGAEWENSSNNVQVRIKDANGNFIEEADFAANNIAIVDDLTDSTTRTVVVVNPASGVWDIELVDDTGLGEVQFSAFQDSEAPTIEVTAPAVDVGGGEVTINYEAFDSDSDAEISLFYDTDNQGFDGILIADSLAETDGAGSFVWNTEGVPMGDYFIYARVMDENNAPVYSYSQGQVQITEAVDLSVDQTANSVLVGGEENLTYTVTVTNNGSIESKGVTLTETLPEDFTFVSATLTPSQQTGNVLTFDLGDLADGESQTVDITVTAPNTGGAISAKAQITSDTFDPDATNNVDILDITVAPSIAINDITLAEDSSGTTNEVFTVSLDAASTETVRVDYATADGTTTAGEDYITTNGTLEFAPGETEKTITVEVLADVVLESDETFFVNLSGASNAIISDDQGVGTIENSLAADLLVIQSTSAGTVGLGNNLTYTVKVTNKGSVTSQGVTLTETLPEDVTFVSATLTPSQQTDNVLTFDLGDLADGESQTVDITVTAPSTTGTINATAQVTSDTFDPDDTNNSAVVSTNVDVISPELPDLAVTRTDTSDTVVLGDTFDYTLTVTNNGLGNATEVVLTENLPSVFDVISATSDLPDIDLNFVDLIEFQLDAGEQVNIDIDANEFGSSLDPVLRLFDSAGNQVAVSDDTPAPGENSSLDSYIDFTASTSDTYYVGISSYSNFNYNPFVEGSGNSGSSSGNYDIEISIGSGGNVSQVALDEPNNTIPQAVDSGLSSANPGTFIGSGFLRTSNTNPISISNGVVTANVGNLDSGESATVNVTVNSIVAGNLISTTNVTSSETDFNPFDNQLITAKTIESVTPASADLELTQTVNNPNPEVGDRITFTLTLTNKGPGIASGIEVTDLLPSELSFVSASTVQGTYNSTTGVWDVGNLRDNLSRTLNITAKVDAAGAIINTAELTAVNEADPDSVAGNNNPNEDDQATVTLTVDFNEITGTPGRDVLTGTDGADRLVGLQSRDILTGGGGNDQFVYTSFVDAGDIITDFEVGSDKIVLTEVLDSLGYLGSDAIADGYVDFVARGSDTLVQLDPDGFSGSGSSRPFILVENVTVAAVNNTNNFLF